MPTLTPHCARVRIQIEFIETPNLKLTLAQVARLCDLPSEVAETALLTLVTNGFLTHGTDGAFRRAGLGRQSDAILGPRSLAAAS
jgi:DNA-binding IclR family transcriptional regulator